MAGFSEAGLVTNETRASHLMPRAEQLRHDPGADEAGRTGEENAHGKISCRVDAPP